MGCRIFNQILDVQTHTFQELYILIDSYFFKLISFVYSFFTMCVHLFEAMVYRYSGYSSAMFVFEALLAFEASRLENWVSFRFEGSTFVENLLVLKDYFQATR